MNLPRRHGARKAVLITLSLLSFLLTIRRWYNASQTFSSTDKLSDLLEVIDSCAPDSHGTRRTKIPNTIHQIWKTNNVSTYITEFGPSHEPWKTTFEPLNYTVKLWTDVDVLHLTQTKYPWLIPTYQGYPHDIQRADLARLVIIHAEGGIYADLDVYPRNATETQCLQQLSLQAIFSTTQSGDLGLSNHFFMAEQGSPFLLWTLYEAKRRAALPARRILLPYVKVLWTTGPLMVTAALRQFAWMYGPHRLDIGVLDDRRYRERILGHAAGRSWHGPDGVALNFIADHATGVMFVVVFVFVSFLGIGWLFKKRQEV